MLPNCLKVISLTIFIIFISINISAQNNRTNYQYPETEFVDSDVIIAEIGQFINGAQLVEIPGGSFGRSFLGSGSSMPEISINSFPTPTPPSRGSYSSVMDYPSNSSYNIPQLSYPGGSNGPIGWVEGMDPNYTIDGRELRTSLREIYKPNVEYRVIDIDYDLLSAADAWSPIINNLADKNYGPNGEPNFDTSDLINKDADDTKVEATMAGFKNSCWYGKSDKLDITRFCQMNLDLFSRQIYKANKNKSSDSFDTEYNVNGCNFTTFISMQNGEIINDDKIQSDINIALDSFVEIRYGETSNNKTKVRVPFIEIFNKTETLCKGKVLNSKFVPNTLKRSKKGNIDITNQISFSKFRSFRAKPITGRSQPSNVQSAPARATGAN